MSMQKSKCFQFEDNIFLLKNKKVSYCSENCRIKDTNYHEKNCDMIDEDSEEENNNLI